MSKRLFVAIDLPDSTRQLLTDLDPHIRGVRWTEPDQMHLTLGFFGNVAEDIELKLREKLSAKCIWSVCVQRTPRICGSRPASNWRVESGRSIATKSRLLMASPR